jgi:lauroyl/myristoyl acyltransferase
MKIHFRKVKNVIARPLHRFGYLVAGLPPGAGRAIMGGIGAVARAAYFLPNSHLSRTVENFCRATERSDAWPVFTRMIGNIEHTALHFAGLYRYGRAGLLAQTAIDPGVEAELRRFSGAKQGVIILVPHCASAVLSSARLSTVYPTVLLVREPKDPSRCQLMLEYLKKLGPEFILARSTPPALVIRNIVRALKEGKVVVGTTDFLAKADDPDAIQARAFDQRIHSPAWPARLSVRLGAPILPGYIHMEGPKITLLADEAYLDEDIQRSTQRWVSSFEKYFRQYPSDWAFMLDKNWARVLAAAASPKEALAPAVSKQDRPFSLPELLISDRKGERPDSEMLHSDKRREELKNQSPPLREIQRYQQPDAVKTTAQPAQSQIKNGDGK